MVNNTNKSGDLRLLCGFGQVPDAPAFSRIFAYLAEEGIWGPALDSLVKEAHAGKVVCHVCRDSTMAAAREKAAPK